MSILIVQRVKEYSNKLRNYKIYLDKEEVGVISDGEMQKIEITSGTHFIYAKLDWVVVTPEIEFNIQANETKTFQVGSSKYGTFKHPKWTKTALLFIIPALLILKFTLKIDYFTLLAIFALLVLLYFLQLGRSTYLTINEIST